MAKIRTRYLEEEIFAMAAEILRNAGYEIIGSADEVIDSETAGGYRTFGIRNEQGERVEIWRDNSELGADKSCWVIKVADLKFREFALDIARTLNEKAEIGKYLTTIDVVIV